MWADLPFAGASTLTVEGPSYLTLTLYPTTTAYQTSTVKIPTTTKTTTRTPTAASTANVCLPGDASVKESTGLVPTHDQSITLYVIAIYLVGISIAWNLLGLRELIFPCVHPLSFLPWPTTDAERAPGVIGSRC